MTRADHSRSDPAREAAELAVLEFALAEVFAIRSSRRASDPGAARDTSRTRWLAAALVLLGIGVVAATLWLPREDGGAAATAGLDLWPQRRNEPASLEELQRRLAKAESATMRAEGTWSAELGAHVDFARFDLDDLLTGRLRPALDPVHLRALAASLRAASTAPTDSSTVWTHHLSVHSGEERSTVLLSIGGPAGPRVGFWSRTGPVPLAAPAFPHDELRPLLDELTARTIERLGLVVGERGFAAVPGDATRLRLFGVPAGAVGELQRFPKLRQIDLLAAPEWHAAGVLAQLPRTLESLNVCAAELPPAAYPVLGSLSALRELFLVDAPMFEALLGPAPCRAAPDLDDRALGHLRGLLALRELTLVGAHCTDAGLRSLADLPLQRLALVDCAHVAGFGLSAVRSLRTLTLRRVALAPDAFAGLAALPELGKLLLLEPVLPGSGRELPLAALPSFPALADLHLAGPFSRHELPQLAACRGLRKLTLQLDPPLRDADLPLLHGLGQLERLQLPGANVGDDALATLRRALPDCTVSRDG